MATTLSPHTLRALAETYEFVLTHWAVETADVTYEVFDGDWTAALSALDTLQSVGCVGSGGATAAERFFVTWGYVDGGESVQCWRTDYDVENDDEAYEAAECDFLRVYGVTMRKAMSL